MGVNDAFEKNISKDGAKLSENDADDKKFYVWSLKDEIYTKITEAEYDSAGLPEWKKDAAARHPDDGKTFLVRSDGNDLKKITAQEHTLQKSRSDEGLGKNALVI